MFETYEDVMEWSFYAFAIPVFIYLVLVVCVREEKYPILGNMFLQGLIAFIIGSAIAYWLVITF